jgi:hypothetical protein
MFVSNGNNSRFVSNRKYPIFDTGEAKSFTFGIWLLGSDLIGIVGIRKMFLAFSVTYP